MDSLTHLVLGAAIGEALMGRKIGKKAMLWGALADTIPDFDMLAVPFFSKADGILVHRGITHSLLFVFVMSPVLGQLFSRFNFKVQAHWRDWTLLFFMGMLTHVMIDAMTAYGTGLLEPFDHSRISFNNLFILEPLYTVPLIVSCIALMILKRDSPKRKVWNRAGLIISTSYILLGYVNKIYIDNVFERSFSAQQISYKRYITTPAPLSNLLWLGIAEDDKGFHLGYYSIFDKSDQVKFHYVNKNDSLLEANTDERTRRNLRLFSNNYYILSEKDTTVTFYDLRFPQVPGWDDPNAPFPFAFVVNYDNGLRPLDRSRMKISIWEGLKSVIRRMGGI